MSLRERISRSRIALLWWQLRSSYWFVPSVMALASAALALATVALDRHLTDEFTNGWTWIYRGGADGARAVLSAVAGSVIGGSRRSAGGMPG